MIQTWTLNIKIINSNLFANMSFPPLLLLSFPLKKHRGDYKKNGYKTILFSLFLKKKTSILYSYPYVLCDSSAKNTFLREKKKKKNDHLIMMFDGKMD